jgi:hypothetical protein
VVPAQEENVIRICDQHCEKERYNFDGILATIDVVAKKKKAGAGRGACVDEDSDEIENVAMNVTNNVEWWVEVHDYFGSLEDLFRAFANLGHYIFIKGRDRNCPTDFLAVRAIKFEQRAKSL